MDRRSFLKLGSLFAAAMLVETSPALKAAAKILERDNTQVLLYLIRNYKGQWKVKGTKYIDVPKTRIDQRKFDVETFRFLGVVENHMANERKLELWKEYGCSGNKGFKLNVTKCTTNAINTNRLASEQLNNLGYSFKTIQFENIKTKEHQSKAGSSGGTKTKELGYLKIASEIGSKKANEKIQCPCCKELIDRKNYKRWHGDNCKMPNIVKVYNELPNIFTRKAVKKTCLMLNLPQNYAFDLMLHNNLCYKIYEGTPGSNTDVSIYQKS